MSENTTTFTGPTIIDTVEQSTMVSNWDEHLCLSRLPGGEWVINVRVWESVCQDDEFWDDEVEDVVLPDEIGGFDVIGVVDGLVLVNNLVPTGNTNAEYKFRDFVWTDFVRHFENYAQFWCNDRTKAMIEEALQRAKS